MFSDRIEQDMPLRKKIGTREKLGLVDRMLKIFGR